MPKSGLNQDEIVTAAIIMLETKGVDQFSMRALASQLGTALGATYLHVGGKERVLALAADRIVNGIRLNETAGRSWQERLIEMAFAYRRVLERYPGIGAYLTAHVDEMPSRHQAMVQAVHIIGESGLNRSATLRTATVINAYVRASMSDAEHLPRERAGRPAQSAGRPSTRLDDETFSHGLDLLIRGIETSAPCGKAAPNPRSKTKRIHFRPTI